MTGADFQPAIVQIIVLGATLVVLGFILAWQGLRPRRVGRTPHCAACDYIVGGIETPKCPECGADLKAAGAIAYGERPRRRRRAITGMALMAVGLLLVAAMLTPAVRRIDWYRHRPTAWVISDLKSANATIAGSAWLELKRRLDEDKLSDARRRDLVEVIVSKLEKDSAVLTTTMGAWVTGQLDDLTPQQRFRLFAAMQGALASQVAPEARIAEQLADRMLKGNMLNAEQQTWLIETALEHQKTGKSAAGQWLLNRLGDWELEGKLTSDQRERFYRQINDVVSLDVRPRVIVGDMVPFRITMSGRGPERAGSGGRPFWWLDYQVARVSLNGRVIAERSDEIVVPDAGMRTQTASFRIEQPGKHKLEVVMNLGVHHSVLRSGSGVRAGAARFRRQVTVSADLEAFPQPPPDYIQWVDDATFALSLRKSIRIEKADASSRGPKGLGLLLRLENPPINVAFDVLARLDGKEYPMGTVAAAKGSYQFSSMGSWDFPPTPQGRIDVILRSSEKALKETTDLYSAWRGEIVYENVPVMNPRK